jgi:hypothetical protein
MKRKNAAAVALGKRGGKVKSDAKAAAARANGKLGGRPISKPIGQLKDTVKVLLLALALLTLTACAYKNPTAPTTPPDGPQAGVPARIELGVVAGVGTFGGTATINVRVIDGWATALPDQTVTVTASAGELSAGGVVTDAKGMARVTITGPVGPTITIVAAAGAVTQKTLVALQQVTP